jgi:hypothetical protein
MRLTTLLAVGAALAGMLQAQLALGATVGVFELPLSGEVEVRYEAALGEINDLIVVEAPENVYLFTDLNAAIYALRRMYVNLTHVGALSSESRTL